MLVPCFLRRRGPFSGGPPLHTHDCEVVKSSSAGVSLLFACHCCFCSKLEVLKFPVQMNLSFGCCIIKAALTSHDNTFDDSTFESLKDIKDVVRTRNVPRSEPRFDLRRCISPCDMRLHKISSNHLRPLSPFFGHALPSAYHSGIPADWVHGVTWTSARCLCESEKIS